MFGFYGAGLPLTTRTITPRPSDIQRALDAAALDIVYTITLDTALAGGGTETLRYSTVGYTTDTDHTPANQHYEARLAQFQYRRSIRNSSRLGGRGSFRQGTARLIDPDRQLVKRVKADGVDGQPAEVRWGRRSWDHDIFQRLYSNEASGWRMNGREVEISLRGSAFRLDKPLNGDNRYAGTGDREGGSDVQGKPKPAALGGEHKNVNPPLLNVRASDSTTGLQIYDLHNTPDGSAPVQTVNGVFDRGVALDRADSGNGNGDFATFEALRDATTGQAGSGADIEAGEFATCFAEGYIRLATAPAGALTVDFDGGVFGGSHLTLPGAIAKVLVTTYGGFGNEQIDRPSYDRLDRLVPNPVEAWIGPDGNLTVAQALDRVVGGVEGWWGDNAQGEVQVGRIQVPQAGDPFKRTYTDRDIFDAELLNLPRDVRPAVDDVTVRYALNYNVQPSDLNTNITAGRLAFVREAWRSINSTQTVTEHDEATELQVETPYSTEAGASAHASDLLDFYNGERKLVRIVVSHKGFDVDLDNKIKLTSADLDISDELFVVIGVRIDIARNTTELILYN